MQAEPGTAAAEPESSLGAGAYILDDATTILTALRRRPAQNLPLTPQRQSALASYLIQPDSLHLILTLLMESQILDESQLTSDPERTREFLEIDRGAALARLFFGWQESLVWNDLANTPGVGVVGGEWPNEPVSGRRAILDYLARIPIGTWWSLESFKKAIYLDQPDFQRPAGDFESWYLKQTDSGAILRGLEDWDWVDGALISFLISRPLHWLGVTDLGFHSMELGPISFRLTHFASVLKDQEWKLDLPAWDASCQVKPTGLIDVPRKCSPLIRYQISRFTAWRGYGNNTYTFQLTPTSLKEAIENGLQVWKQLKQDNHLFDAEVICMALAEPEWIGGGVNLLMPREDVPRRGRPRENKSRSGWIERKSKWLN
jgi:hypothetical protein